MKNYLVDLIIPYGSDLVHYVEKKLKAETPQQAVDFAFSREINKDEEHLKAMLYYKYICYHGKLETVIQRDQIEINMIVNDDSEMKSYLSKIKHPSRLTDTRIKELLKIDSQINGHKINIETLKNKTFLI